MILAYAAISDRQTSITTEASEAVTMASHSSLEANPTKEQSSRMLTNKNKQLPHEALFSDHFQRTHHPF